MSLNPSTILNPQVTLSTTLSLSGPSNLTWNTFADADATPDISAGTFFKTANTGATSITDFTGNTDCLIFVRADDNYTTIVHDVTKIILQGGIDITLAQNDIMMFVEDGGVWYETTVR